MRTRTRLTTPPGQEPDADVGSSPRQAEVYSPALGLPREPRVRSRYRRLIIGVVVLAVVIGGGYVGFRVATSGQFQDPALTEDPGTEQPATEAPTDG